MTPGSFEFLSFGIPFTNMFPGDTHLLGDGGYPLLRYLNKQSVATIVNLTAGINSNVASYWFT